ncbi:class I adenylate-forming enzyme family protein [Aquabacter cavernae]|uniref:class I adenylate-forming enzyme family protein n=1 Tax=Aquabacter cavernae TaxID=2496029 RepID=UPI000F8CE85C|nr:class I adenylate-forming enzyme family protein [Aquabacter cavernae]
MIRREVHFGRLVPTFAERPATVDAMFRARVTDAPDAPALVAGERRISYGQLDAAVDRLTASLRGRGIVKGDRVATLIGNRPEVIEVSLACGRLGAIHVPMDIRQRAPEIAYALTQSEAALLLHDESCAGQVPAPADMASVRHTVVVGAAVPGADSYEALLRDGGDSAPPARLDEDDPFCILYTSGTTGRPKGAVLTHFGVIHSCLHYRGALGLTSSDRVVLAVPCAHVTGLVGVIHTALSAGACLIMMAQFKARAFLELAERERASATLMVPAMYSLCLLDAEFDRFDLSSWRVGAFGGAPMPEPVALRLKAKSPALTLFNVYGSTETTSPVAILPADAPMERLNCVGKVLPCADIRVMDEAGREVAPGEAGELWIAGASVVPGYWRNPEADAAGFTGGYWRSGDVGSIDAEGYLKVFDRKKDMINRAGYKVYSAEVESVIVDHPGVSEAAVVGYPDPVLGERVAAFVTAKEGVAEDSLRLFCAARLSDYKVPDRITFLRDGLPRNANGKVLKAELRSRAVAGAPA